METASWIAAENFYQFSLFYFILFSVLGCSLYLILRKSRTEKLLENIPGPRGLPLLGNALEVSMDHEESFDRLVGGTLLWRTKGDCFRVMLGQRPMIFTYTAQGIEQVLNNNKHIQKSRDYRFLHPWLGTGLLTSTGRKWHSRRKLLTPAFHFKILEDFVDVFSEHSDVLVEKLKAEVGSEKFNIFSYVSLCALDNICESVMGRQLHAQNSSDSEYVRAVYKISDIVADRQYKPWKHFDILFNLTKDSKEQASCLDILHGFTQKVIRERREELRREKEDAGKEENEIEKENGSDSTRALRKRRLAFLDLLIHSSMDGTALSDDDIQEEVDTFMFEGHDTVSAGISWCLYLLGCNPDCQKRILEELDQILGNTDRKLTLKDLSEMKYLECCIKEAQRIYPSVPMVGRELSEDMKVLGYTFPAGSTVVVFIYLLHRNPDVFPNPEVFNPENFMPHKTEDRHPYAYVPFSAGPRNCIGQKVAMMEEKIVISKVLRKYRVEAVDKREDLALKSELILRSKGGLHIKIFPRT